MIAGIGHDLVNVAQFAEQMQDEVKKYKDMVTPAIILIPGKSGSLGIGMKNITDSVERAVGADIL